MPVTIERHGEVLVAITDHPPVNALAAPVRIALNAAIDQAAADERVRAVVIACAGRTFFAGADITEFTRPPVEPLLPELVDRIEGSDKPVVAAVHGTALGGGCEVAIACHYRIAVPSARFGTPEVKLGLLPGAGGTQRLPRLVGIPLALEMTAKGEPVSAATALQAGLIDRLAAEDRLLADAIAFAREVADVRPIPRTADRPVTPDPDSVAAFEAANARRFRGYAAPAANIACVVKAAELPFAEGLAYERARFLERMGSTESAALRHLFFAERKAARIEGLGDDVAPRPIRRVGIVGAGTMGGGIAMNFLSAGLPVTIVETQVDALDRGVATIRRNYEATAAKGRMAPHAVEGAMALLDPVLDLSALAYCDLVIEAVYEDMAVKQDLFRRLAAVAKPGAILATNTSFLDVDAIAAVTGRAQDVLGLHFFSPANVMKLLEVVRADHTADDVLATAMALAKRIGKTAVVAGVAHGFIGNRMLLPRQEEATKLLLEGATPEQVDRVHVGFGMPMGPFQMSDLAGIDIGWHRDPTRIESIRDALCAEGRLGQKAGAGFYDYDAQRTPTPSPRVAEILAGFRGATPQRAIDDREIIERTLYPMVNEAAAILAEGKAQRASDIDVVWVQGYGWPAWRGGPMFWAATEGLDRIVAALDRHGFAVTPLLRETAAGGGRFA
ncbi:3-hydroxyacyl-CoA dehydrogenase NAD-binding domain-containing protein [Sphingomonas silueang]|uniref:3-hydroxyacyl-CoA dehydrogenase NAD-binding domain-containing protein n=1 Tax=Sphingomonas silueang TaxID=3156617 RepID=UPI0032B4B8A9